MEGEAWGLETAGHKEALPPSVPAALSIPRALGPAE